MPRIRSIKPEFWADEALAELSRDARLLLIGMFNFADDHGRMRGAPMLIRAQVFPYDTDLDVDKLLSVLASPREGGKKGFIVRYEAEGESFIWIRNFNKHQKIDHPSKPQFPEPPPDVAKTLASPREPSLEDHGASGKISLDQGEEGSGEEGKGIPPPPAGASVPTWDAYEAAYRARYGVGPVRNVTVNAQLKAFVKRIGAEEAPLVAAFYLRMEEQHYVKNKHGAGPLLQDCEGIRTAWATKQLGGPSARVVRAPGQANGSIPVASAQKHDAEEQAYQERKAAERRP